MRRALRESCPRRQARLTSRIRRRGGLGGTAASACVEDAACTDGLAGKLSSSQQCYTRCRFDGCRNLLFRCVIAFEFVEE